MIAPNSPWYIKLVAAVLVAFSLAGCQEPTLPISQISLPPDARRNLGSIEVVVSQFRTPIYASSMPARGTDLASGVASGLKTGLLAERVELVNKALSTFDYADDALKITQQAFARLDNARLRVSPTVARSPQESQALFDASSADAVMNFYVHYSLGGEHRALRLIATLALIPKSEALRRFQPNPTAKTDKGHVIYRNQKGVTRYFMGAEVPERVRSEFDIATRELAAWAASEANALLK